MNEGNLELSALAGSEIAPPPERPAPGIGLCLSGGGFRAMLFHAGSLWRLNEVGLLNKVTRISSVSGGSITAAWLGRLWEQRGWGRTAIPANEFRGLFVGGLCRLARHTVDIPCVLRGFLPWCNVGREVARVYDHLLFQRATLQDLPDAPRFILNASNLQSGALWRFSKPYMGDWKVGLVDRPDIPLAWAVAASSAFPPVLSPFELKLRQNQFVNSGKETLQRPPFTTRPILSDGGVYDNLGLETVFKHYQTVLVSDGGAPFRSDPGPAQFWPCQLVRVLGCIDNQVGALRKQEVIGAFKASQRDGCYWGIATTLASYPRPGPLSCSPEMTARLAGVPTRLARLSDHRQHELINWGYAACAASIDSHYPKAGPDPAWPYPDAPLG